MHYKYKQIINKKSTSDGCKYSCDEELELFGKFRLRKSHSDHQYWYYCLARYFVKYLESCASQQLKTIIGW